MASAVNEQIATLEAELKSLNPVVDEDGDVVSTNPRAKELTEDINKLKEQAATLEPYHATAGLVITSGDASIDTVEPAKSRLILISRRRSVRWPGVDASARDARSYPRFAHAAG